ncbi:MAG: M20/M25/M40 family metallo-hydrolase [Pseudomonadota bacterium]
MPVLRNAFRLAPLAGVALSSCLATAPPPRVAAATHGVEPSASATQPKLAPAAPAPPALSPAASSYVGAARRIREASLADDGAYRKLSYLTDQIGARLSGSSALEKAVTWAKDMLIADGHEQVALEPVRVPHWVRGAESATLLTPIPRPIQVLTLGGSVATPPGGLTAELLVVGSFDELEARKAEVKGKIVLFDHPMSPKGNAGLAYGEAIAYRVTGAARAAPLGALAVLVRSLTTRSLGVPHTGSMRLLEGKAKNIPAASVSVEDAELLHRLASSGRLPKIQLTLRPQTLPDADSANVIGEIRGRELPNEIVLIGAHLDSWDVGQGAQDDGAGVVTVLQALTTLRSLGLIPRRTLRAVLFSNEENGRRGAAQYAKDHSSELAQHVAAFEMDAGSGSPLGFMTEGEQPYLAEAREYAALLSPIGADHDDCRLFRRRRAGTQTRWRATVWRPPRPGALLRRASLGGRHARQSRSRAPAKSRGSAGYLFLRARRSTRRLAYTSASECSTVSRAAAAASAAAPTERLSRSI